MDILIRTRPLAQILLFALGALAGSADAADSYMQKLRVTPIGDAPASAADPAQKTSPAAVATQPKALSHPSLTPGAAQSLNPQPLPPKALINPMPGVGLPALNGTQPRINGGMMVAPALTQPAKGMGGAAAAAMQPAGAIGMPGMEDRAIIIVSGKKMTAGELKKTLFAEIAAKAGAPKTFKSRARTLDFTSLNSAMPGKGAPLLGTREYKPGTQDAKIASIAGLPPASGTKKMAEEIKQYAGNTLSGCVKNGPPKISEVEGKLMPGKKVTVWGECFGKSTGRVEIIGPFPGGKLAAGFTAWSPTSIELAIPDVRGATDSAAALSVVTADGKTSAAVQTKFFAARERIEVPDRLWTPNANFELASAEDVKIGGNKAHAGRLAMSLRLNPQCALDTMDVVTLAGGINAINGFEQGPPNEAAVTLDWVGTCAQNNIRTDENYIIGVAGYSSISFTSACRVAFHARAWAYCPVGVAP